MREVLRIVLLTSAFTVSYQHLFRTPSEMASKLCEAEKKFWETTELVEKLLPLLDPESTLNLARCHEKIPGILQGSLKWNQFIRRACPFTEEVFGWQNVSQKNIDVVRCLVAILKLIKHPDDARLDLLELICERFPQGECKTFLQLTCSSHPEGHRTSIDGFLLLEEVEGAFSSTDMKMEMICKEYGHWNDSVWSAICARLSRCEETMTSVRIRGVHIEDVRTMMAFRSLLKFCPPTSTYLEGVDVDLNNLAMTQEFKNLLLFCPQPRRSLVLIVNSRPGYGDIGYEGWALSAKAVLLRPGFVQMVSCCHHVLQEARKEDMRLIWEVVGDIELVNDDGWNWNFKREEGEKCWRRLAQVMDMTEDELLREIEEDKRETRSTDASSSNCYYGDTV